MRKKGNLDTRIQECGDLLLATEGKFTNAIEFIKAKEYIDYEAVFGNNNPVYLDVGCGLGGFAIEFAKQNPNINLIAIEMFSNVIIGAIDKAREYNLPNLRFLNIRCECL
ncbi:MAG: tRNA (guanosine(46)-N7)-methyltransferase TrmB, partial [Bacilli bacterium]|nr:tRNA (guanosine(46)-N7)-methyltransferase TrmB [Bacilli bacterium]